jgi:hypothetical protein
VIKRFVAAAFRPASFSREIQTAAALLPLTKQNRPPEGGRYNGFKPRASNHDTTLRNM